MARILDSVIKHNSPEEWFLAKPTEPLKNLIGGEWKEFQGDHWDICNPLTGKSMWQMPLTNNRVGLEAIRLTDKYPCGISNKTWPFYDRGRALQQAGWLIRNKYWNHLRALIKACFLKSNAEADGEIELVARMLEDMSSGFIRSLHTSRNSAPGLEPVNINSEIIFVPHGLCSIITAYNYPLEIPGLHVAAAAACGNILGHKPNETSGPCAQALCEILIEAGVPPEFMILLHGYGPDLQEAMLNSRTKFLLFTGSTAVADKLISPVTRVEDAGLNWSISLPMWHGITQEELELVAERRVDAAFKLNGQRCSCERIAAIHKSWIDAGLLKIIERITKEQVTYENGNAPILMTWSTEQAQQALQELADIGCEIKFGGEAHPDLNFIKGEGLPNNKFNCGWISPSLFTIPLNKIKQNDDEIFFATLLRERFFGNLGVIVWETEEDLLAICNMINRRIRQRLTCAIITKEREKALDLIQNKVRANGITNWQFAPTTKAENYKPFGPAAINGGWIGGDLETIRSIWLQQITLTQFGK